jgi:nitrite reductase/ring-hydroxylating ferredoxin subunit
MTQEYKTIPLEESPRFQEPLKRRDFLGLAAIWSATIAFGAALLGSFRLPMPSVFPESNSKVKIGRPEAYPLGTVAHLADAGAWLFHDSEGLYAISTVCTHLGCIAKRNEDGSFLCPCHGSAFEGDGAVVGGPAPKGLNWLEITVSPDGQLQIDKTKSVEKGTRILV